MPVWIEHRSPAIAEWRHSSVVPELETARGRTRARRCRSSTPRCRSAVAVGSSVRVSPVDRIDHARHGRPASSRRASDREMQPVCRTRLTSRRCRDGYREAPAPRTRSPRSVAFRHPNARSRARSDSSRAAVPPGHARFESGHRHAPRSAVDRPARTSLRDRLGSRGSTAGRRSRCPRP